MSATARPGQNPTPPQLYGGAIPPLSTLVLRTTPAQFVRKVTQGAPILMGAPPQLLRGRMPVFYYLSEEEAEDVYLYLTNYPPQAYEALDATMASSGPAPGGGPDPGATELTQIQPPVSPTFLAGAAPVDKGQSQTTPAEEHVILLAVVLGLLASTVLCLGFWFSVRELRRLSGDGECATRRAEASVEGTNRLDAELAA